MIHVWRRRKRSQNFGCKTWLKSTYKDFVVLGGKLFKNIGFSDVKWTEQADNPCG